MWKQRFKSFTLPILVSLLLISPSLLTGLQLDDYYHWGLVTDNPLAKPGRDVAGISGLFTFTDGNAERTQWLIDKGLLPWWTLPEVQYSFWRPVSEITHLIDYTLWPQQPVLMHLHSVLYFVLLLIAGYYLMARWLTGPALGWAFWIFSLSYTHGFAVGWLANRNALLATLFVALTLYGHDRWRREHHKGFFAMALLCFLLGLLSGEIGVSGGLFLLAYALCLPQLENNQRPIVAWFKSLLSIAPYGLLGLAWLAGRSAMGYGAEGSGHYIDPTDIEAFLGIFAERYLQLVTGLFWSLPPEFAPLYGEQIAYGVALVGFLLMALVLYPVLKVHAHTRFFLLSCLLILVPVCATTPHSRLLIAASLPLALLVGVYFGLRSQRSGSTTNHEARLLAFGLSGRLAPLFSGMLLVSLLGLSPLLLTLESVAMKLAMDGALNKGAKRLAISEQHQDKVHVILNPPLSSVAGYIQGVRAYYGLPLARAVIPLSSASQPVTFTMLANNRFRLAAPQGLYDGQQENLLRSPAQPLVLGEQLKVAEMSVTVTALNQAGIPTGIEVELADNQSYIFHLWHRGNPVICRLPPAGTQLTLTQDTESCSD